MVGPTVQDDLVCILLRFRQHKYGLSADVEKVYRQIVVHPDDRHLQQIVWRESPTDPLKTFQLKTVTYGYSHYAVSINTLSPYCIVHTLSKLPTVTSTRVQGALKQPTQPRQAGRCHAMVKE
ncbi:hypothetical protein EVAR_65069_1 [Eumeta japonica]|uniref:Uncharacterized protein n=1 Tax=Eumeta variegata TaxID=151549 RepID=A0A4C1ZV56_EUMVA|nr:hypothetical protein EVAR_65069_1 [Eumeta japonica]